jgi:transaldolase/glucose-6-phosphate isomerase
MYHLFKKLEELKQSVWLDFISRDIIHNGNLKQLIDDIGLKGVTSNPTIFQKAIASGSEYDEQLKSLLIENTKLTMKDLFEFIAVRDIQNAADILQHVYESSLMRDGYVNLEVSPDLAYDTDATIKEALKLFKRVNRPNVMIKIPATQVGIPAIRKIIYEGVSVNVTLIFSPDVYKQVVDAYISGLEDRLSTEKEINKIASVASFFISRIDTAVDKLLEEKNVNDLSGKIAIANAKIVYQISKKLFSSERFLRLKEKGAQVQRLLWASTSTKNPTYSPTIYVDELIGANTVNTLPPETIEAFKSNGTAADKIETEIEEANMQMIKLKEHGIDFAEVTQLLTIDGVKKFADSFHQLLMEIESKKKKLLEDGSIGKTFYINDKINSSLQKMLNEWASNKMNERIWQKDYTVWKEKKEDDVELSNRLGWLELPYSMQKSIKELEEFAEEIKSNFKRVVLLGMGGSSLAPEVFFKTFGNKEGYPDLTVLDSTHPASVKYLIENYNLQKTFFIAASKSGGTIETMSFFYTFFEALKKQSSELGRNFAAITDAGTSLEKLAKEKSFRKIFTTPEDVGGRYSVFTYFGLLPAALIGVDLSLLLQRASEFAVLCANDFSAENNPTVRLGVLLGLLAEDNINKLTLIASPKISAFPVWIEQLIAESTGKEGKGILPIVDEALADSDTYGNDRLFVYLRVANDENHLTDKKIERLIAAGFSVIKLELQDEYDLAKEFYRWELATAAAGAVLKINPFDQPNVQLAKTLANESIAAYIKTGSLPSATPLIKTENIYLYGNINVSSIDNAIYDLMNNASEGYYVAIMAFIHFSDEVNNAFEQLRTRIRDKYKIPVTLGYGPRFLHSTGQLHKGDNNNGLFIQITSEINDDIEVSGKGYSFGTLISAQAQGDYKALVNSGRKVLRFHIINSNIVEEILKLKV